MASTQFAASQAPRFQPPPSSILATHVVSTSASPVLTSEEFANLLQEVLGPTETGELNNIVDTETNLKLLNIILLVGVLPFIDFNAEGPFKKPFAQGANLEQLKKCLDVLHLAVDRSPQVLFKPTGRNIYPGTESPPIHVLLLAVSASLNLKSKDAEIVTKSGDLLRLCLVADCNCPCGGCSTVSNFHKELLNALSQLASQRSSLRNRTKQGQHEQPNFTSGSLQAFFNMLTLRGAEEYVTTGIFIATQIFCQETSTVMTLQVKKSLQQFESLARRTKSLQQSAHAFEVNSRFV